VITKLTNSKSKEQFPLPDLHVAGRQFYGAGKLWLIFHTEAHSVGSVLHVEHGDRKPNYTITANDAKFSFLHSQ